MEQEVLGVSFFGQVEGSPLIPSEAVVVYFMVFFVLLAVTYTIFHYIKKPLLLKHKIKLVLLISLCLKIALISGVGLSSAYFLIPSPNVVATTPAKQETKIPGNQRIEIVFDRPVDRKSLEKHISPEVPGVWNFEDSLYSTHLYRKLIFYPTVSLRPDTTYTITLLGITNLLKISKPEGYTFSFTTQSPPTIASVSPGPNTQDVEINSSITVTLSDSNDKISEFDFIISPELPFNVTLAPSKKEYIISPSEPFKQGVTYSLSARRTNLIYHIPTNAVIERSDTTTEYEQNFTTKEAPGILHFTPAGENIYLPENIKISFSDAMNRASVESNFKTEPTIDGIFVWTDDKNVRFIPKNIKYETSYTIKLPKGTKAAGGGFLAQDVTKYFSTIGRIKTKSFYPEDGWAGVGIKNPIRITFDQLVDKQSAERKFSISPKIDGTFSWEENTLVFTPSSNYSYSTTYTASVESGVESLRGLDSTDKFSASFVTQDQTIRLAVPSYLQKYTLSCEIAALRMALAFKGINLSEDEILYQVGFDNTPRNGGTWGNPHLAFVGNVNGRQMIDGYGTYWGPIARVAKNYRQATDFTGWKIDQLTNVIANNNPVVVWVYSKNGSPVSWNTPQGSLINAVRGEHAVVAVGFVGEKENPSMIIVNDPLIGQVYWQRGFFEQKWNSLGRSGVVVY